MSGGIKLNATSGGSTTLLTDDALAVDETVVITKAQWDKLEAIDPKSLATAWITFDGSGTSPMTIANGGIKGSFNIDSVTRTATGLFDIYFSTAMDNINYAVAPQAGSLLVGGGKYISSYSLPTINSVQVSSFNDTGTLTNRDTISVQVFGGKN